MDISRNRRSWNFPGDLAVILSFPVTIVLSGVFLIRLHPVWFSLFFDVIALGYLVLAWRSFHESRPLRYWRRAVFAALALMMLLLGASVLFR